MGVTGVGVTGMGSDGDDGQAPPEGIGTGARRVGEFPSRCAAALTGLFALAALAALGTTAEAASGWYVSGGVSGQIVDDLRANTSAATGAPTPATLDFDAGLGANASVGYSFDSNDWAAGGSILRIETELLFKVDDTDTVTVTGAGSFDGTGDVSAFGVMANAWYELHTGWAWRPYLGAGVGIANISLNNVGFRPAGAGADLGVVDDDDWVFAYQFGAGISYELSAHTILGLEYRMFATTDAELVNATGTSFDADYLSHNVGLFIRFLF